MIHSSKMDKLKFPKDQDDFIKSDLMPDFLIGQGEKQVARTVVKCVDKFNDRYPPTCAPEERATFLADRAASVKTRMYNIKGNLLRKAPGSEPKSRKAIVNLKGSCRLMRTELYYRKIHDDPAFVHTVEAEKEQMQSESIPDNLDEGGHESAEEAGFSEGGSGSREVSARGDHAMTEKVMTSKENIRPAEGTKNKKMQESGHDLQLGRKLAKQWLADAPEDVQLKIEQLAKEDSERKAKVPEEGSPEAVKCSLDLIELLLAELTKTMKQAGWMYYVRAGGLVPGDFLPRMICLNVGKNEQGKTWGQHHANYEEHVTEPFAQFLCSAFPDEKCKAFQEKMASFYAHPDSDNHPTATQAGGVQRAIVAGLEEGMATVSRGDETETSVGRGSEGEGSGTSDSSGLDGSTTTTTMQATPAVAPPTTAMPTPTDLVTPMPTMSSAPTATTTFTTTMATAPSVAVVSMSLNTGTESIAKTWSDLDKLLGYTQELYSADNPSQCPLGIDFQSIDPNYLDLDLSRIDYSDSSLIPFDASSKDLPDLQGEAWNPALDLFSQEEMLYYLSLFNQPEKLEEREGEEGMQDGHAFQDPSVMDVGSISTQKADSTAVIDPPAMNTHEEEDTAVALCSLDLHKEDNVPRQQPAANEDDGQPPRR
ncbi:hypothetical protein EV421DRAFT_1897953 [Armillaria borealis]|uniref:Uncharacterized protein n=1 Tax=Armillaria borealis TaxID=47425 RepID=A0AA39N1I3_9AGAR|nr:hypothetical protein EV421DRAFT_1897953 [Armillaria borealis]